MESWVPGFVEVGGGQRLRVWQKGRGPALLVVGGALRSGLDYRRFGDTLSDSFRVTLLDRRGRAGSPAMVEGHSMELEVSDLCAVQVATSAQHVFAHSFGGLVTLEAAARGAAFRRVVLYEPGVSIDGSIATSWVPRYLELLASGDRRRAFAWFVHGSGQLPRAMAWLPLWYLTLVLRLALRGERWAGMNALLEANALEHELVARQGSLELTRFSGIDAAVLLLGGSRSPRWMTVLPFEALGRVLPRVEREMLAGLGHLAPDDEAPVVVAERASRFFAAP
ncbi:MAG: alpha/beta hydrolase [Archangiaceae bacterium]|nr:alpha/beta hydrolase [Archangiaceae bacterium]